MSNQLNQEPKKVEIAGAITYPANQVHHDVEQPRQPSNLQGLLRFAMEATKAEDAPHETRTGPIDADRMKFLESALNSMTVNVMEVLQSKIKVLQNVENLTEETDISEHELALDTILEYVDNTDIANDFHKIGGFTIFQPCLRCVRPEIQAGACNVLAELCQNNPYCQRVVLDNGFIPSLLQILTTNSNLHVCVKALYALSCIVRQNTEGFHQLVRHEGLCVLLTTLEKDDDKLRTKTTFLLSSLCRSQPDLKSWLVFLEYIPVLLSLLMRERTPSHEHILSLLLLLIEDNHSGLAECRNPKYNLKETISKHLEAISDKEECQEEVMYYRRLQKLVFENTANGL